MYGLNVRRSAITALDFFRLGITPNTWSTDDRVVALTCF